MTGLFDDIPIVPAGFRYIPGFIDTREENDLLKTIGELQLHTFTFQGYEAKRKVASFGYDYSFERGSLTKGDSIPENFQPLIQKVSHFVEKTPSDFGELLVTAYPVGSVINWHRDAPPFDVIVGISLGADCLFKLRPHEVSKRTVTKTISVPVARRSLYIIAGESRTHWQHSIAPVKKLRHSITLRTLRQQAFS